MAWERSRQPPLDLGGVGAARQIEHGAARGQRPEPHAARDRQPDRFGQLEFAPHRARHVAARREHARVETPAVHADEHGSLRCAEGRLLRLRRILWRLLDNPGEIPVVVHLDQRKRLDAIRRDVARSHEIVALERRQPGLGEPREIRKHGGRIEIVGVQGQEHLAGRPSLGREERIRRP